MPRIPSVLLTADVRMLWNESTDDDGGHSSSPIAEPSGLVQYRTRAEPGSLAMSASACRMRWQSPLMESFRIQGQIPSGVPRIIARGGPDECTFSAMHYGSGRAPIHVRDKSHFGHHTCCMRCSVGNRGFFYHFFASLTAFQQPGWALSDAEPFTGMCSASMGG